uniref:Threonylcarbamoyl-AMP synthase n=1 Tax=Equus caballus TaxID=9796 RepID=A0A9L0S8J7_HORSE
LLVFSSCTGHWLSFSPHMGLSEGLAGSAWSSRLLCPPSPALGAPGAQLLRLPGSGAIPTAAVVELDASAMVAVPTNTLYSLACSGRSEAKLLAVCLGLVADIYRYCHVRAPEGLLKDLLPVPMTLVMERSEQLNKDLNPFTPLVGIRIPDHAFMQDLARVFGGPLPLTSANLSSQASSLNVEEFQDLWPQLSLVIDGEPAGDGQSSEYHLGSAVVDVSVPGRFGIICPGCALESTTAILQQKYRLLPSYRSCL